MDTRIVSKLEDFTLTKLIPLTWPWWFAKYRERNHRFRRRSWM